MSSRRSDEARTRRRGGRRPGPSPWSPRLAIAVGILAAAGCATQPRGGTAAKPPGPPPSYAELAEAHNEKVARLRKIYARGVVEVRWTEGDERRFVQGDAEVWIRRPCTALRVSKLADVQLWLGSDADRYWLFDLVGDQRTLVTADHRTELAALGAGMISVRPLALLDLMGLTPLAERGDRPGWRGEDAGWVVSSPGAGGSMRLVFDPRTRLLKRIESVNGEGEVVLASTLRRYGSVSLPGVAPLEYPRMAEVVAISDPRGGGEVTLFFDEMTGDVDEETITRLCDLERLIGHLRPEHIVTD